MLLRLLAVLILYGSYVWFFYCWGGRGVAPSSPPPLDPCLRGGSHNVWLFMSAACQYGAVEDFRQDILLHNGAKDAESYLKPNKIITIVLK